MTASAVRPDPFLLDLDTLRCLGPDGVVRHGVQYFKEQRVMDIGRTANRLGGRSLGPSMNGTLSRRRSLLHHGWRLHRRTWPRARQNLSRAIPQTRGTRPSLHRGRGQAAHRSQPAWQLHHNHAQSPRSAFPPGFFCGHFAPKASVSTVR